MTPRTQHAPPSQDATSQDAAGQNAPGRPAAGQDAAGQDVPRRTFNVAFVGEVDHGKSTLLGRLLYDTGALPADRLDLDPEAGGLAFLLDGLSEEREGLFTLDTTRAVLETPSCRFVLIDVPGHGELLKNMVSGASRADAGVVVVDVHEQVAAQTRRHLRVLELLGVRSVLCAVTKMDLAGYDPDAFERVAAQVAGLAAECGLEPAGAVPVGSLRGDNVAAPANGPGGPMPWYTGRTLFEAMDALAVRQSRVEPPRFVVGGVLEAGGVRRVVGRVESGTVRPGQELRISPGGGRCAIELIERFGEPPLERARTGDDVGLRISGDQPAQGSVLAPPDDPPRVGRVWRARVLNTGSTPFAPGRPCLVRTVGGGFAGRLEAVHRRWETAGMTPLEDGRPVGFSELAEVRIRLAAPVAAEEARHCPPLGRFMFCDADGTALGPGVIDHIETDAT
ncbi:GTP-binding protein [Actinomadura viridis]|uniref:Bifunctional enzyme CysN/CysC/sulfate adenylyltransferase subunit 1 n=1 Tax=Actinomadura viridis TaxID=58110 RepID=A0A931DED3_9ACTN|nr:GTP-binding protein [Actinomadura viridis]MBG6085931.1 bifunctional enzyme CysN/CysC/sulfate adenylyltransferase subunit 1 [Actinomadura viridis]